jgi:hypothetical protein
MMSKQFCRPAVFAATVAVLQSLSSPANADREVVLRDYLIAQERVDRCLAAATTFAETGACAGKATRACLDPNSDWPEPMPRDCTWDEVGLWDSIYQVEVMRKLAWAQSFDAGFEATWFGGDTLFAVMRGELAWKALASSQCSFEELPDADKSYEYRVANESHCLSRMFAERIFYLRSLTNMLPRHEGD